MTPFVISMIVAGAILAGTLLALLRGLVILWDRRKCWNVPSKETANSKRRRSAKTSVSLHRHSMVAGALLLPTRAAHYILATIARPASLPIGISMRPILFSTLLLVLSASAFATPRFAVNYDAKLGGTLPAGRLFLILSNDPSEEPRMQVNDSAKTQQLFGIDVEQWSPATPQVIDAGVLGYPRDSLREVPAGKYRVQAVLHRYETFKRPMAIP